MDNDDDDGTHAPHKWQPVILILDGRRLECHCGALAIFITGKVSDEEYNSMDGVDVWCQSCFDAAQQRGAEKEERDRD